MEFTCSKTDLLRGVQTVSKAIPSSTTESILRHFLLKADTAGNELSLFATDNRISIRQKLQARIGGTGELCVPGSLFADILQTMQTVQADDVGLVAGEDNKIRISAEGASYDISGIDPRSFPLIPAPEGDLEFSIDGDLLRQIIRQIAVTAAAGPGVAQGYDKVLLEARDGVLTAVTTDTVRLAVRTAAIEGLPTFDVMVPAHALQELAKILSPSAPVKVLISDDEISFTFGDTEFQARLCEREFPDYRKIIPKEHSRTFVVDAKAFTDAIKGVMPVARENKSKVHFAIGGDEVVVTAKSHEGEAMRKVPAVTTGEPLDLAFNAKFVLDFLSVVDADRVHWGVTSSIHPASLHPAEGSAQRDEYLYLLMPINI